MESLSLNDELELKDPSQVLKLLSNLSLEISLEKAD